MEFIPLVRCKMMWLWASRAELKLGTDLLIPPILLLHGRAEVRGGLSEERKQKIGGIQNEQKGHFESANGESYQSLSNIYMIYRKALNLFRMRTFIQIYHSSGLLTLTEYHSSADAERTVWMRCVFSGTAETKKDTAPRDSHHFMGVSVSYRFFRALFVSLCGRALDARWIAAVFIGP